MERVFSEGKDVEGIWMGCGKQRRVWKGSKGCEMSVKSVWSKGKDVGRDMDER